jgi:hypothetical protein
MNVPFLPGDAPPCHLHREFIDTLSLPSTATGVGFFRCSLSADIPVRILRG